MVLKMSDKEQLQQVKSFIHVQTVYYMNLLLEEDLPEFKKSYLQGKLDMLKSMNKQLFNGKAQVDYFD